MPTGVKINKIVDFCALIKREKVDGLICIGDESLESSFLVKKLIARIFMIKSAISFF